MLYLCVFLCLGELEWTLLQEIDVDQDVSYETRGLIPMGNKVYFTGEHPLFGLEWMSSDGTTERTELVADIIPGIDGSHPRNLLVNGHLIYFSTRRDPTEGPPYFSELFGILDTRTDRVMTFPEYPVDMSLNFLNADSNKRLGAGPFLYWSRIPLDDRNLRLIRVSGTDVSLLATFRTPSRYRLSQPIQMAEGIRFVLTEPGPRLTLWGYEDGEFQSLSELFEADPPQPDWWVNRTRTFLRPAQNMAYVSVLRDQMEGDPLGDLIAIENDRGSHVHRFEQVENYRRDPMRGTAGDAVYFEDTRQQQAGLFEFDPDRDGIAWIARGAPTRRLTELPGNRMLFTIGSERRLFRFDRNSRRLRDFGFGLMSDTNHPENSGPMFLDDDGDAYFGNRDRMYRTDGDTVYLVSSISGGYKPIVVGRKIFAGSPNQHLNVIGLSRRVEELEPFRGIVTHLGDSFRSAVVGDRLFTMDDSGLWVSDGQSSTRLPFSRELGQYDRLIPIEDGILIHLRDGLWRSDGTEAGTVRLTRDRMLTPVARGDETYAWQVSHSRHDLVRWRADEAEVILSYDASSFPSGGLIPGLGVLEGEVYLNAISDGEVWFARLEDGMPIPLARIPPADPKPSDTLQQGEGFMELHSIGDDLFLEIPAAIEDDFFAGYYLLTSALMQWIPESRELVPMGLGANPIALDMGIVWLSRKGLTVRDNDGTLTHFDGSPHYGRGALCVSAEGVSVWFRSGEFVLTDGSFAGTTVVALPDPFEIETDVGWIRDRFVYVRSGSPFPKLEAMSLSTGDTTTLKSDRFRIDEDAFSSIAWDGAIYFTLWDPEHGDELWTTDGTEEGTRLVLDAEPGPAGSYPNSFAEMGGSLIFRQFTSETGPAWMRLEVPMSADIEVDPVLLGNCPSSARVSSEIAGVSYVWEIDGGQFIGEADGPSVRFEPRGRRVQLRLSAHRWGSMVREETTVPVIFLPYLPCPP